VHSSNGDAELLGRKGGDDGKHRAAHELSRARSWKRTQEEEGEVEGAGRVGLDYVGVVSEDPLGWLLLSASLLPGTKLLFVNPPSPSKIPSLLVLFISLISFVAN
jgi:hypothetical protein